MNPDPKKRTDPKKVFFQILPACQRFVGASTGEPDFMATFNVVAFVQRVVLGLLPQKEFRIGVNSTPLVPRFLFPFLFTSMFFMGCGLLESDKPPLQSRQSKVTAGQVVTLDGYDASVGITVLRIALWKDYKNVSAGISTTANHGEGVRFMDRVGDSVLVETRHGRQGWVNAIFIKEFK